jgi:hypothetical protein
MMLKTLARVALISALAVLSSAAFAQPAVTILGGPFAFGPSPLGVPSSVVLVSVQNTGTSSLTITNITASGDFSIASTPIACQVVVTVAAGGTCTVFVQFTATALGVRNGVVSITDNAPGTPHTFQRDRFRHHRARLQRISALAFVWQPGAWHYQRGSNRNAYEPRDSPVAPYEWFCDHWRFCADQQLRGHDRAAHELSIECNVYADGERIAHRDSDVLL